jgi:O-antigen ligase
MAAKRRNKTRRPGTGISAGQTVSPGVALSTRTDSDWVAPAIYGVFFLLLFLAFSPALESRFVLPKTIVLAAGVLAFSVLLLVRIWRGQSHAPPRSALLLSLALGAWWIGSTIFALHLPTALNGEYNRYNGLWTHLCWLALFVASMSIPFDLIAVRRIAALLAAAIVPVAAINVAEATGLTAFGLNEVSTLGDRVAAGALMNFAIPFIAIALVRTQGWGTKAALGSVLALLVVSEILFQGRGPWMGLVAAAVILAIGLTRSGAGWKVAAAMLLTAVMLAGAAAKLSPAAAERFATMAHLSRDQSLGQRFVIYGAAFRAIREHPVAGIGFDNFRNSYPSYRDAKDIYFFNNVIPTMAHDGYLQAALTNGIPALLLYVALVAGVLIKLVRALSRDEGRDMHALLLGFLAALTAYLVQDLTGWLDIALTSVFWIMLGLALNLASQTAPRSTLSWAKPVIAAFSASMVFLSMYLLNDRYARVVADRSLFEAQALDVRTQWPKMQSLVSKALSSFPGDSRSEMVAGQLYAMRFASSHDPSAYAISRELLLSSFEHNRFDRLRLFNIVALESTALDLGQISTPSDFAQEAVTTLAQTDSENPAFHEIRAWHLAAQGRFDDALAAVREARRLAPLDERLRSREADYEARLR